MKGEFGMKCDVAKIRALIAETGKSEVDFLHSVALGSKILTRWENGTEIPREDYIAHLANKLGIDVSDLLCKDVNKHVEKTDSESSPEEIKKAKKRLNTASQHRIEQETKKRQREKEVQLLTENYLQNPNLVFRPMNTTHCSKIPKCCPICKGALLLLNVPMKGIGTTNGWCCIKCSRHYLKVDNQTEQKPKAKKQTKKGTLNNPKADEKKEPLSQLFGVMPEHIRDIPNSTILLVYLREEISNVRGEVAIVSNEKEQDSKHGIYWVGRDFPSVIMLAIQNKSSFSYQGRQYKVEDYEAYGEAQKYLSILSRFCNASAPQDVYVFSQKNLSTYTTAGYEAVTAMIPCANRIAPVPITVYYERATKRYFMNEESYIIARKTYGLPYIKLRIAGASTNLGTYGTLKEHSELNLLGYSVGATNGMEMAARRNLLSMVLDNKIMDKPDIMNHLEWLIHTRKHMKNMENAVGEWRSDLQFVLQYKIQKQRHILVRNFKVFPRE